MASSSWYASLPNCLFLSLGPMPYIVTSELFQMLFEQKELQYHGLQTDIKLWSYFFFPILKDFFASIAGDSAELGSVCLFGLYTHVIFFCHIYMEMCAGDGRKGSWRQWLIEALARKS